MYLLKLIVMEKLRFLLESCETFEKFTVPKRNGKPFIAMHLATATSNFALGSTSCNKAENATDFKELN